MKYFFQITSDSSAIFSLKDFNFSLAASLMKGFSNRTDAASQNNKWDSSLILIYSLHYYTFFT